jgi:hypothetical protein
MVHPLHTFLSADLVGYTALTGAEGDDPGSRAGRGLK